MSYTDEQIKEFKQGIFKKYNKKTGNKETKDAPPKPRREMENIRFFEDKGINEDFNKDFYNLTSDCTDDEIRTVKNLVFAYKQLVPNWNYSSANTLLSISLMEVEHLKGIKKINEKDHHGKKKGLTKDKATSLNVLLQAIENAKKQIGIDSKSLAAMKKGSIADTFVDVIERFHFNPKRFVCKPIFGLRGRGGDTIGPADSKFKDLDDKALEKYLDTAEAE